MLKLEFKKRDIKENLSKLRKEGFVPAVFYGHKEKSTPISVKSVDFMKIWKQAGKYSVINLDGNGVDHDALIHAVDLDPITSAPLHTDFYVIEKGKKLKVNVPVEFIGVAPAVKDLGGILVKVMHNIEIEALPKDLPQKIEVDISPLTDFGNVITAKDAKIPANVTLITKTEEVVASVYEPKEEVEEVAPVDLSAIEVEKKGKEVVEGESTTEEVKK